VVIEVRKYHVEGGKTNVCAADDPGKKMNQSDVVLREDVDGSGVKGVRE
jgi:hypothetical protein